MKSFIILAMAFLLLITSIGQVAAQNCGTPPSDVVSWWPADSTTDDVIGGHTAEGEVDFPLEPQSKVLAP